MAMRRSLLLIFLLCAIALAVCVNADAPEYRGEPSISLGDAQFLIELGDQEVLYLPLDDLGRVQGVSAIISRSDDRRSVITDIRPSGWQQANYAFIPGLNLYNRCHLLAHQLGGADIPENLFTGTQYINQVAMGQYEDYVAAYTGSTGNHVRYEVIPYYNGDDLVCHGVFIAARSIEDDLINFLVYCFNVQPGVSIDYANGFSTIADTATTIEAPVTRAMPEEPDDEASTAQHYILNTNSKRFHYPDCPSVEDMKEKNKRDYNGTREELIEKGYKPCGRCQP